MANHRGVLSVTPKATGYTHIAVDGGVATQLVIVVPTEYAHDVLAFDIADVLNRLAHTPPHRTTELTT